MRDLTEDLVLRDLLALLGGRPAEAHSPSTGAASPSNLLAELDRQDEEARRLLAKVAREEDDLRSALLAGLP